ncbi:MAG: Rpn family recombination-promoting nuclease/putative transposase [Moorea sp. SIO3I7]|uniref:Rpn family recombination-promoting nuclease/putative transposase n=1 Tax=unclassified Moorena TaxID=2683338 RepID=UPI0013C28B81|nr:MULTISPECIES: Rpn family recombination-promoting nuclease/putative transposase [unclassified Moorena]NEN96309.1 Rpn family recombination-promoting nuclease/putative transposase [Moorena sp. SIO3I7]NEO07772.1 Rpn family recombination-promoting nuclease/putative transposase [Moorena sp. SIO3I8]NEO21891.1 Rpn family recombination-promoting nuclease/putative transposase [Moorena sp. SIO4A5]NEP26526.1 Rpn family recombination-promoting nuclease/putative transposase [Moorena sp. SIO3I6]NEQ60779.1
MRFISPKIDYVFKKIFGSKESQTILISFLNAIIYNGEPIIKSLTIINPYNPGQVLTLKDTYLDVKAVLADGEIVLIEMQVSSITGFSKRVLYNMVKGYVNQLKTAEDYIRLKPVIAVTITDFILFDETQQIINQFVFQEKTEKFECLEEELQLIFIELPKFHKRLSELETLADKWIYFIKEASSLDNIPPSLGEVSEIESALNLANQAGMTPEELEIADRRAMALQDERGKLTYAEEIGRKNEAIALIMRQLKKRFGEIDQKNISKIENLTIEELENLGEDFLDFNNITDLENWLN